MKTKNEVGMTGSTAVTVERDEQENDLLRNSCNKPLAISETFYEKIRLTNLEKEQKLISIAVAESPSRFASRGGAANIESSKPAPLHALEKWRAPTKYAEFAENPLVKSWLADYKANNTKTESCKRLARLFYGISMTPEQVIAEIKSGNGKAVKERVKEFCRGFEEEGKTAMASLMLQSFRSFLISHEVGNMVNWSKKDIIPILAVRTQRRPPKKEEIYRLIDGIAASRLGVERIARYKAMILTAWQSGLRPSALLRLKVKDIDLTAAPPIPIQVTPCLDSKIRRPLGKIGFYWTFIGKEAQLAIKEYLDVRHDLRKQEITPESPLFEQFHYRNNQITLVSWNKIVAHFAAYGGFKKGELTPHQFRHAARKQFRLYLDDQVGTVLLGHTIRGAEEAYFDRRDMEYLRNEYSKIQWSREKPLTATEVKQQIKDEQKDLMDFIVHIMNDKPEKVQGAIEFWKIMYKDRSTMTPEERKWAEEEERRILNEINNPDSKRPKE